MNYRQQQKEIAYARVAFYLCMALALFVGFKEYSAAKASGLTSNSELTDTQFADALSKANQSASGGSSKVDANDQPAQNMPAAPIPTTQTFTDTTSDSSPAQSVGSDQIDTSMPTDASTPVQNLVPQFVPANPSAPTTTPVSVTPDSAQPQAQSANNDPSSPSLPNPTASQTALMAYLVKSLPDNITMLKSLIRAESELTQGDATEAGQVDQTLAHPMAKTTDQQPSDVAIDQVVAALSKSQGAGVAFGSGGAGSGIPDPGLPAVGAGAQNLVNQMGMSIANAPLMFGIICFALGLAAQKMFKRHEPGVIYRPQVGSRIPNIFLSTHQGYAQRSAPDLMRSGSFQQYRPYFVGQELETNAGAPIRPPAPYGKLRQASRSLAQNTNKMVRRFLEL